LAISQNSPQIGTLLTMQSTPHHKCTFVVNATPVLGADEKPRGAMATFDDVTSIEEKNLQLEEMLQSLKMSFEDVRQKNKELKLLAARDPLTGCLNRRSLFDAFVIEWQTSAAQGTALSCVMVDVDHFRAYNEEYGLRAGDDCVNRIAEAISSACRKVDAVGRYGGDQFVVLSPETDTEKADVWPLSSRMATAEARPEAPKWAGSSRTFSDQTGIAVTPTRTPV
jgi:diguanylate cyclase (GGDEF)-like protein